MTAILGDAYRIVASVGHVRDLPAKDLGVAPPDFQPVYMPTDRGKEVLAKLKLHVANADRVLLATDPDREGEAIAWHLADALKLRAAQRISFNEITTDAVRRAVTASRSIDMDLVRAQEARRVLDRLVGYRVSPVLSDRTGKRLSAGRVQSPAVRLVVDRQREIEAFNPTEHYGAELIFEGNAGHWRAQWDLKSHLPLDQEYLLDRSQAVQVAAVRSLSVVSSQDGESLAHPASPFTTSTLQQVAGARLRLSPKAVMDLAQRLYEQGAISYHRTDSPNLSVECMDDIAAFAKMTGLPLHMSRRTWKAKEGAQEGHEAIRPTHAHDEQLGDSDDERALYALIRNRAIASQLAPARYTVRAVVLAGNVAGIPVTFLAKGQQLKDPGWQRVYQPEPPDDGEMERANPVPALVAGQPIQAVDGNVMTKTTKAPARFKLSTLVAELERRGIGRPSTYAAILENITSRGYVIEDVKGFLSASDAGIAIRDALVSTFSFAELDYTRALEDQLDGIATRRTTYAAVISQAWIHLTDELNAMGQREICQTPSGPECPECGKGHLRRIAGKAGHFWGCDRFRDGCKATFADSRGKPVLTVPPPVAVTNCPFCKIGTMRQREANKKKFWGCTNYPTCRGTVPNKRGKPDLTVLGR